ncbi:hypothetical protein HDC92_005066 [Pedobacter sp. AK017]|uniref:FecR family protein n=1 Tax=Pedobacter sp. AK017 TaxID=2723073 RepID=UPI00162004FA|nr:FecR family protein [Pedobacter sp. AK017]MBB5441358.1 hypothetical protein [Pedobacter sp. AK017]
MAKRLLTAKELLEKYEQGTCTEEEAALVMHWYETLHPENFDLPESVLEEELDKAWMVIQSRKQVKRKIKLWKPLAIAGILLVMSGIAWYFYEVQQKYKQEPPKIITDVSPGGNRATLKLASGKVIELDSIGNGIIANEKGITISKGANGQIDYSIENSTDIGGGYNTITTPIGGVYQLRLPDGSKVWLNAGSSLTYAPSLNGRGDDKRRVSLAGEAYFEISKDKQHPFIVTTRDQEVEILGTHFNINSYKEESAIRTTLLEGSVRVHALSGVAKADKVLRPGEQAVLTSNGIKVMQADTETITAWKDGLFLFKDADVPTIMRQLSRWYNVEVEYNSTVPSNLITGGIERNNNLTTAMKMLELVGIKYQLVQVGTTKKIIIN